MRIRTGTPNGYKLVAPCVELFLFDNVTNWASQSAKAVLLIRRTTGSALTPASTPIATTHAKSGTFIEFNTHLAVSGTGSLDSDQHGDCQQRCRNTNP